MIMLITSQKYRPRQFHWTSNGVNPSNVFRDIGFTKSSPHCYNILSIFGPWASPYRANGQTNMTLHIYRSRKFHKTSNAVKTSSRFRNTLSSPWANPYRSNGQIPMTFHNYKERQSIQLRVAKIHPIISEVCIPADGCPYGSSGQPWANPFGSNGPIAMMQHNHRPR